MPLILKLKLQDYSGNRTLYKNECNIADKQKLVMIFSNLLAFGLDIRKIAKALDEYETREMKEYIKDLDEEGGWFK